MDGASPKRSREFPVLATLELPTENQAKLEPFLSLSLSVLVSLFDLATCPSRLHASRDHHPFMTVHTKVGTEVEGKRSFTDHGPLPMTEQTWPRHNLQCFFYWRIFAKFRPGENRYDFHIYKGFSMEKNDPNSPYFEFLFPNRQIFLISSSG
jgi:hypothetical protein